MKNREQLNRENTVMDHLSSSKRRFIENWRQNVSMFMENGNICRVTIGEVTPEPAGDTTRWHNAENLRAPTGEMSPRGSMTSPSLPAVKFSYSHAQEELARQQTKGKIDKSKDGLSRSKTTLPPSPNGVIVQNGMDIHQAYKRRTSAMRSASNTIGNSEITEVQDNKESTDTTRKSSKIAREIYEKYNMQSSTHNALLNKRNNNGYEQFSMPWRNKTFLSLPLRFNGSIQKKDTRLSREKSYISDLKYNPSEPDEDLKFTNDWKDLRNW